MTTLSIWMKRPGGCAAAWAENATKAMIWRNCLSFMSADYCRFYLNMNARDIRDMLVSL